ncbi:MAG: hypothetical protein LPL29_08895 [Alphaproteobacteria bacterium]|nr:hypothetical protein [Alphaproteobacteria bacterium]
MSADVIWMVLTGVGMPVLTLLVTMIWRSRREDSQAVADAFKTISREIAETRTAHSDFRVYVAEKYVSAERFDKLEQDMRDGINRLETKIDRLLGRG